MMENNADLHSRYFPQKPNVNPQIYAFSLPEAEYAGILKIGYTSRNDVNIRIKEEFPIRLPKNTPYKIEYVGKAVKDTGEVFMDHDVHTYLENHGIEKVNGEFYRCTADDVKAAVLSLQTGEDHSSTRTADFKLRKEQQAAIDVTAAYFKKQKHDSPTDTPKFLWNAKMRFGKTFTTYELAKSMKMKRVLVISFKTEVEDSWRTDLNSHVDFEGWQFVDTKDKGAIAEFDKSRPLVAFGSFQDLLGKNELGGIKAKNEWIHTEPWDMIVFDEYHFGAWRTNAQGLFEPDEMTEEDELEKKENRDMDFLDENDMPITSSYMLYLSGTPFRAIRSGEFLEDQIFNWAYGDEQQAKADWNDADNTNPYAAMPEMVLMTYQLPESVTQIALKGEFDEFDLNEFFKAEGKNEDAHFIHENEVQRWLDIIRGKADISSVDQIRMGAKKPVLPYYDESLQPLLNHTLWFLPRVASCYAMANLLAEPQNRFYSDYKVIVAAGSEAGMGAKALGPVREAMGDPLQTKTITLTCRKLTTGVTVKPWSGIFMLCSIKTPESYFQSAFRVQSGWSVKNEEYGKPDIIVKRKCYIFDFAPNRALRQLSDYACNLNTDYRISSEDKVSEFIKFLPVLAFDGSGMYPVNAAEILDYVSSGTTASLLAKKWDSALLVNVDNDTLTKIMNSPDAMQAIMSIEGFRALGSDVFETIINKSKAIKDKKATADDRKPTDKEKKMLSDEEKKVVSLRKKVAEKLRKFSTRIPLFMYLTDYREHNLQDVITKLEPELFKKVTGLSIKDFNLLVSLNVFNAAQMNDAIAKFRRYEDSSLTYTGVNKHEGEKIGMWNVSVSHDELYAMNGGK